MNIAILDDQPADREKVSSCLLAYFSEHPVMSTVNIFEFESGESLLHDYPIDYYQFILIDYYMDGISGLETARQIRTFDNSAVIIFISTSLDHAVDGYKVKASGYLVKPFKYQDLEEIMILIDINKIRNEEFIELEDGKKPVRILLNDIIYCDVAGHYVQIYTQCLGRQRFRMTFSKLTGLLKPFGHFLPCYRGCVINMEKVQKVEQLVFLMENGDRIPFRKKEEALVMEQYTNLLFEKVRKTKN